ncbi:hypothetical protein EV421DRAFT_2025534 [Armillaria borealis]|uniref:Uncharacterized protein n=1 Tax=Armillaria borealis TaxID=47425 RepID=A0AA39MD71_9AGAR|nr:hypothetical protein EV421DRAFT_2025534 [Armillaria borealis]
MASALDAYEDTALKDSKADKHVEKRYTRHHKGRGIGTANGMTALVVDDKVRVGRRGGFRTTFQHNTSETKPETLVSAFPNTDTEIEYSGLDFGSTDIFGTGLAEIVTWNFWYRAEFQCYDRNALNFRISVVERAYHESKGIVGGREPRVPVLSSQARMNDGDASDKHLIAHMAVVLSGCHRFIQPRICRGDEGDAAIAVKRRGAHLIVFTSRLLEERSLRRTDSILVPCFSVLATSISRQFSPSPSSETYCQHDSIGSSLFSSHTPSNVRTSPLEHWTMGEAVFSSSSDMGMKICVRFRVRRLPPTASTFGESYGEALQVIDTETGGTVLASRARHLKPACRRLTVQSSCSASVSSIIAESIHSVSSDGHVKLLSLCLLAFRGNGHRSIELGSVKNISPRFSFCKETYSILCFYEGNISKDCIYSKTSLVLGTSTVNLVARDGGDQILQFVMGTIDEGKAAEKVLGVARDGSSLSKRAILREEAVACAQEILGVSINDQLQGQYNPEIARTREEDSEIEEVHYSIGRRGSTSIPDASVNAETLKDRKCVVRDIDGTHARRTDTELTPDLNEPVLEPIREYIKDLSADGNLEFSLMALIEDDTAPECIGT